MNEEVEQVQITLAQLEAKVEKAEKWKKLVALPLFEELVTKDYLGDDAVRLTMNLKPKAEDNEKTHNMLFAKASFSKFVGHIIEEGYQAEYSIQENEQLRDELDAEVQ